MRFDSSGIPREGSAASSFRSGRRSDRCAALLLPDVGGGRVALLGKALVRGHSYGTQPFKAGYDP
jgi:hypothetical protein